MACQSRLRRRISWGIGRACPGLSVPTPAPHVANHCRVRRRGPAVGILIQPGPQIVAVKLAAPAPMISVVGLQPIFDLGCEVPGSARVRAQLAAQTPHRIFTMLEALVIPTLDGGQRDSKTVASDRMFPIFFGQRPKSRL